MAPDEPQLFPNQPSPDEHVQQHKNEQSPFEPQAVGLNEVATRLKILEERYGTLRKKSLVAEQNIIESDKEFVEEMRLLNDTVMELKHTLRDIIEKVGLLNDEVQNFADKNDLRVLDRYMSFWEPMDFVTRKEVNNFLRARLGKKTPAKKEEPAKTAAKKVEKQKVVSKEEAYPDTD